MRLALERICWSSGGTRILDDASLEVAEGSFCVLIGPTGCGKTTLLKTADLLARPDTGSVRIDGVDLARGSSRARTAARRRMAMVMQRPWMLSGTVSRNVLYGPRIRGGRPGGADVEKALQEVGLDGFASRRAGSLSGGEMQKVAIARALITGPRILFLDEPLSSVDPGFRPEMRALVRKLHRDHGMTVLMATHDFPDALALGTHAAVMFDGAIAQHGTVESVFMRPATQRVAKFVGMRNVIRASVDGFTARCGDLAIILSEPGAARDVFIAIPPEAIAISLSPAGHTSQRNTLKATVTSLERSGWVFEVGLEACGIKLAALVTAGSVDELALRPGLEVCASFKATSVRILD
jgi:tungstate transport system ATP-binding protein